MKHSFRCTLTVLVVAAAVWLPSGDASAQARSAKPTFPKHVGAPPLEYAGKEEGYPPKIRGAQNVRPIASRPLQELLPPQLALRVREAATSHAEVKAALGAKFVYITSAVLPPEKPPRPAGVSPPSSPRVIRVLFYSYSKRMAVEARLRDLTVLRVILRPRYMPPETTDEVQSAIALARADPRLKDHIGALTPRVLLSLPPDPGRGQLPRIVRVSFAAGEEADPAFDALVDLVEGKVLDARSLPKRP